MNEMTVYQQRSTLTLSQQKVAMAVISRISPDDTKLADYKLTLRELSELTGIDASNLRGNAITDICVSLTSTVFVLSDSQFDVVVPFFQKAEHDKVNGHVFFRFSPELEPHLLNLRRSFTTYHLHQITRLSSGHSIRMYEIMRQHLSLADIQAKKYKTVWYVSLTHLRSLLNIKPTQYLRMDSFKSKILLATQAELTKKTDLTFTWTPEKNGRKITGFNFCIKYNKRNDAELAALSRKKEPTQTPIELEGVLLPENVPFEIYEAVVMLLGCQEQASYLFRTCNHLAIREAERSTRLMAISGKIKTTPKNYFIGALNKACREIDSTTTSAITKPLRYAASDNSWTVSNTLQTKAEKQAEEVRTKQERQKKYEAEQEKKKAQAQAKERQAEEKAKHELSALLNSIMNDNTSRDSRDQRYWRTLAERLKEKS